MFKVVFSLITSSFVAVSAHGLTEAEYLAKNKAYTDELVAFYAKENISAKQAAQLAAQKKTADADLKKAATALTVTTQQLTKEQTWLNTLNVKQANKAQLESDLQVQKQQNSSAMSQVNAQLTTANVQLQNINAIVGQLENEKSLILQKVNTQKQLVSLAEDNIGDLEWDIRNLQSDIWSMDNSIRSLERDIQQLQMQKNLETDPNQQMQLQNQISSKQNQIQQLQSNKMFANNTISSKQNQIILERSQLAQVQSQLNILNIQLNGKQGEINSQVSVLNQVQTQVNGLKAQQSSLLQKSKAINSEMSLLANLPTHIATTEQNIAILSQTQIQQQNLVQMQQATADGVGQSLQQLTQQIQADKANVLASEAAHEAALNSFLATSPSLTAVIPAEGAMAIDSLLVTENLAQSKDWSVFKGTSTTLNGAAVCGASTQLLNAPAGVVSELMVLKLINADGSFSSPFLVTTHSTISGLVTHGQLKTDKTKNVRMPLLQSPVAQEKALISRYSDTAQLISALKAHNSANVEFVIPGSKMQVPFSLRGSSAMISDLESRCKN